MFKMDNTPQKIGTTTSDLPYYGMMMLVFIAAKLVEPYLGHQALQGLLAPVSHSVAVFTGSPIAFFAESGYHLPMLSIVIDKSCSGFNFLLIAFIVIGLSFSFQAKKSFLESLKMIFFSMMLSYLLTILANTSRIISIIKMNQLFPVLEQYEWVHAAQGTFVYLLFLVGFYLLLDRILNSRGFKIGRRNAMTERNNYEKLEDNADETSAQFM